MRDAFVAFIAVAAAGLSLAGAPALAGWDGGRAMPLRLKIYGFVGDAPPADVAALARWRIDAGGQQVRFVADRIEVLTGATSYMNVVAALAPYDPAFRLNAGAGTLSRFTGAAPKERLVLEGVLTFGGGARIFMLDRLQSSTAAPTPRD